jgi:hypothetical protein
MIVTAKFSGTDGSCGYRTGNIYELRIIASNKMVVISPISQKIEISYNQGTEQACPYLNIITFLQNWDEIKVISK